MLLSNVKNAQLKMTKFIKNEYFLDSELDMTIDTLTAQKCVVLSHWSAPPYFNQYYQHSKTSRIDLFFM